MIARLALVLTFAALGCNDDGGRAGSPDAAAPDAATVTCSVAGDARSLFEELVKESLMDLVHTTVETHPGQRGFASQLVGVEQGNIGHLTLLGECTEATTFDPY